MSLSTTCTIGIAWDGAGAEDVDGAIVEVLQPTLLAIDGVSETSSRSREEYASITLEFEPGWDMAQAQDDVNSALDSVTNLPADADDPEIRRNRWYDRVTDVVIKGPVGCRPAWRISPTSSPQGCSPRA